MTRKIRVALGATAVGIAFVMAGCSTGSPVSTSTRTLSASAIRPSATQQAPAAPTASAATSTAPTTPSGPADSFAGEGTYVVGTDIAPGTYRSPGPSGSSTCYWARLGDLSGTSIIANNISEGPAVMAVAPTDAAVEVKGCARWTAVPGAPPAAAAPGRPTAGLGAQERPTGPAAGASTDEYYRNLLRADGVFFPSDADALAEGHRVCDLYSSGAANNSVTQQVMRDYPDLSKSDAMKVGRDATLAYCTQYS